MKHRYNPVLIAVIVLGLVCALWLNWTGGKNVGNNEQKKNHSYKKIP